MNILKHVARSVVLFGCCGFFVFGCTLDGTSEQERGYVSQDYTVPVDQGAQKTTVSNQQSSGGKDSVQKSTPGPKRAAAPQLPVIQ